MRRASPEAVYFRPSAVDEAEERTRDDKTIGILLDGYALGRDSRSTRRSSAAATTASNFTHLLEGRRHGARLHIAQRSKYDSKAERLSWRNSRTLYWRSTYLPSRVVERRNFRHTRLVSTRARSTLRILPYLASASMPPLQRRFRRKNRSQVSTSKRHDAPGLEAIRHPE